MPVISAANLKGGVGKSSLVLHDAGALARLGKRVLVVDNDPQASATAGFLVPRRPGSSTPPPRSPRSTPATSRSPSW